MNKLMQLSIALAALAAGDCAKACSPKPTASAVRVTPVSAPASSQSDQLASFRFFETWNSPPLRLKEVSRSERMSIFKVSDVRTSDARALFILCSLAEITETRGFSHLAIVMPKDGENDYALGMFNSDNEDMAAAFGKEVDLSRLAGSRPGATSKLLTLCPSKPVK